jgi:hypothetical protein
MPPLLTFVPRTLHSCRRFADLTGSLRFSIFRISTIPGALISEWKTSHPELRLSRWFNSTATSGKTENRNFDHHLARSPRLELASLLISRHFSLVEIPRVMCPHFPSGISLEPCGSSWSQGIHWHSRGLGQLQAPMCQKAGQWPKRALYVRMRGGSWGSGSRHDEGG